jgi:hypothetical protein
MGYLIARVLSWLLGSRLGRGLGMAVAAVVAFAGIIAHQRRDAVQDDRHKAREADNENATDIRNAVERDLPSRVREYDGHGFRD